MSVKRPLLLPLTALYGAGLALKNQLRDAGVLQVKKLQRPVISVGSLSAGGAGKTPVVIMLAHLLRQHGHAVDVLSRGYGRNSATTARVPHDSPASAALFGDEPVEMTRAGLHVFVGRNRHAAGLLAEATLPAQVHLLDDGFQHRQLARSLDIVLLTKDEVADHLLPAGNLREPLSALRRADIVVLREEEAELLRPIVQARCDAEIWVIRRRLLLERTMARPFVFCGIARPDNFLAMLRGTGLEPVGKMLFRDHHRYSEKDIDRILAAARAVNADGFYTTQKDHVKLSEEWLRLLQTIGPVENSRLGVELVDPDAAMQLFRMVLAL